jgi:hypothetical protein
VAHAKQEVQQGEPAAGALPGERVLEKPLTALDKFVRERVRSTSTGIPGCQDFLTVKPFQHLELPSA